MLTLPLLAVFSVAVVVVIALLGATEWSLVATPEGELFPYSDDEKDSLRMNKGGGAPKVEKRDPPEPPPLPPPPPPPKLPPPPPPPPTQSSAAVQQAAVDQKKQAQRRKGIASTLLAGETSTTNAEGKKTLLG